MLIAHVTNLSSYTKDTIHFLQILDGMEIPKNAFLITIDVKSLYNNIPHEKGLQAVKYVLGQQSLHDVKFNEFILQKLHFILHHNYFSFSGSHYLQVCDVAMGTSCAPSYANLYLGVWEQEFLADNDNSDFSKHIMLWQRYKDDLFII